jgi:hypothetical protein
VPKSKRVAVDTSTGLDAERVEHLEKLLMEKAEREPAFEPFIFRIAREAGLERVTQRITRLRRYAKMRGK